MSATAAEIVETAPPRMTLEEFLAWDGGGHVGKLELWNGRVRAMAPASATHAIIQLNFASALKCHLRARGSPCRAATEAPIVPPMGRRKNARAPDIAVTCAPVSDSPTFDDPVLIAEVMSPGKEDETWASIESLLGLVSLKEVVVVQSTRVEVEVIRRDSGGGWPRLRELAVAGGTVRLASLDLDLPVTEVYAGTHLA
jgi:Uma2 family endonuclease